ncbi:MAG: hypothetical protein IJO74_04055 [Clostridia bacterium]|nr:hypothetical protein [Clostridia bacterium]
MLNEMLHKLGGIKKVSILTAVFLIGIGMVFSQKNSSLEEEFSYEFDYAQYVAQTEERLCEIISQTAGVGKVKVMITLESTPRLYYERNTRLRRTDGDVSNGIESEETLVFQEQKPILVTEIFPKVNGVAVVCDGAKNKSICEKIIGIVSCALNVSSNRIYVTY